MEAIESTFSFPPPLPPSNVRRYWLFEIASGFVKVWLEIHSFAETEVVRPGAGLFRKPCQVGLGIESAERTAPTTPRVAGIDCPDIDFSFWARSIVESRSGSAITGASAK